VQKLAPGASRLLPPRLAVRPELTDDDVAWLNRQLELVDRPEVRFARTLPLPPPPSGRRPPPVDKGWIRTTLIR
jgi:hypothetical protein